jgi:hypothetical protein
MNLPDKNEYNPYFEKYINLVPQGNFLEGFYKNTEQAIQFFKSIPLEKQQYRYALDKWTCKDILMHIIDTERVMSFRVLVAMRGDATTPLQPVDENLYAKNVDVSSRSMDDLLEEFEIVRRSSEKLFQNMTEEQSKFLANGVVHPISARALGYIIQGHVLHHLNVIKEKYISN